MSDNELKTIANAVSKKIIEQLEEHKTCRVFSDEDIRGIKEMASFFAKSKKSFFGFLLTVFFISLSSLLLVGLVEWLKTNLGLK